MPKPIGEQVVVITGASSGIGRETALRFARQGAAVVLVARNLEALQEVERQIASAGGRARASPAPFRLISSSSATSASAARDIMRSVRS